jgi:hypothetical protein
MLTNFNDLKKGEKFFLFYFPRFFLEKGEKYAHPSRD